MWSVLVHGRPVLRTGGCAGAPGCPWEAAWRVRFPHPPLDTVSLDVQRAKLCPCSGVSRCARQRAARGESINFVRPQARTALRRARAAGTRGSQPAAGRAPGRHAHPVIPSQGAGHLRGRVRHLAAQAGQRHDLVHVSLLPYRDARLPVARDVRQDHQGRNQEPGGGPLVVARMLEQMAREPLPVIGAEPARAQVDS